MFILLYPIIKNRILSRNPPVKNLQAVNWSRPSEVLGTFINGSLPDVTELKLATDTATANINSANNPGQQITDKTEQVIRETVITILNTVKESVSDNVSINQEKIVQDVTAKLLQQILGQIGGTSRPVDQAVYNACSAIVNNAQGTGVSSP